MHRKLNVKLGDRVAFSREFLRNTGQFTGRVPFARGEVICLTALPGDLALVEIRWDDGITSRVLDTNLVREDRIHLEPV